MIVDDTVGAMLAASLRRGGDRPALRMADAIRTHRELLDHANRFANALRGSGLRPGDPVALMLTDRFESVEAYLGCLIGGFAAVHVNDRWAAREVQAVLADAGARGFVYTDGVGESVSAIDALGDIPAVIAIGEPVAAGHHLWSNFLEAARPVAPDAAGGTDPNDLTIIGYTSGTTGRPKGVVHTQRSLSRTIRHMPVHFEFRPRNRTAFTGTLSFVSGIWGVLLPTLYLGGEVSFMAGLDADEWISRMIQQSSMSTYVPTPLAGDFNEQIHRRPEVLRTLRSVLHSGSQIPPLTLRRTVELIGARMVECYGMTETGAPVTTTEPDDWSADCRADDIYASAGRPMHLADVRIIDRDGAQLPTGETGEISVSSETQFLGYLNDPALTAQTLVDGRIRTGDVGRLDDAGYLYVTDRAKDMILSGGMNVFPAEVESAMVDVPGLQEIAVFGIPHERWGETVVAVAVRTDADLDEAAVIEAARARLASYKKPTSVRFVDALPRTASLKIDKPALRRAWVDLPPEPDKH
ncbi:class I adenylate-forming enzyme family protein [Rudaeicoccus suwonensis]|uniref:Fatty-acyl-CoA synthase/long-chain acyl-CoA synthetase n=1 Tax=Rudaeicoccus suwonensis TaxID=657409 RepID=A0A561DX24_9MICO|nr:class I adenylate-forming enzyme family protein [Rudaeicoccus suwonensis]TWE07882.1 fatty-acyl-CoA synthase/long-chain acyl-CoA synthetase [Rudaeicoccus suwonensis]